MWDLGLSKNILIFFYNLSIYILKEWYKTYVFHERKKTLVLKEKYLEKFQYFMKISGKRF